MLDGDSLRAVITDLTCKTIEGKVKWSGSDMTCYQGKSNGVEICAWWYQDDKPTIAIGGAAVSGYDCGINRLLDAIRASQKSLISEDLNAHYKSAEADRIAREKANIDAFNAGLNKYIFGDKKRNR